MRSALSVRPSRSDLFHPIEEQFNSFFDSFFQNSVLDSLKTKSGYPKIDVLQEEDAFYIRASVAGVKPENLTIELNESKKTDSTYTGATIKISGYMDGEYASEGDYYVKELHKSSFSRVLGLPDHIKGEPEAKIKDGILTLKWLLPKKENVKPSVKRIEIKSE